ncbi:hypothetical protein [Variovorax ginsengisoli]|uniref:Uncharacterized protein n=1 Tax=Variovorax ginsengisoli TaxID=363844 RepID=A0ABT8SFF7_9BURK|nr:hypothetical protein [Variovorax ginsengisoli]MDN8618476.1 hypothetical protein [Variovorax ginsengisoli]MDO1537646.1 hypothetical protein [Variovorax ginsengisoli]
MKAQAITFADFEPGRELGAHVEAYAPALATSWQSIFGRTAAGGMAEGASLAVVLAMRAYLTVVSPRPPGNIQARQRFQMHSVPRTGEAIRSEVRCIDKQIKRERLYVDLQVQGTGEDGRVLYTAVMSLIWAQ